MFGVINQLGLVIVSGQLGSVSLGWPVRVSQLGSVGVSQLFSRVSECIVMLVTWKVNKLR
jgi:hypothetical protein